MEQTLYEFLTETQKNILASCVVDDKEKFISLLKKEPEILQKFPRLFEVACQNDSIRVVQFLWQLGEKIDLNILPLLCLKGCFLVVKFLIRNYIVKNNDWLPLVLCACKSGNLNLVKYLIGLGYPFDEKAVCSAAVEGHTELLEYFFEIGFNVGLNNNYIFRVACEYGFVDIIKLLYRFGFDFNTDQSVGVAMACMYGQLEILQFLTSIGVDMKNDNHAAFYFAIRSDNIESLKFLLQNNSVDYNTLLCFVDKVKELCENYPSKCAFLIKKNLNALNIEFPLDIVPNNECPVCLNSSKIILPCRHCLCLDCLYSLIDKKCPVCRYEIDTNLIKRM